MSHHGIQVLRGSFKTAAFLVHCKQYPGCLIPTVIYICSCPGMSMVFPVPSTAAFQSGTEQVSWAHRGWGTSVEQWEVGQNRSSPVTCWRDKAAWSILSLLCACGSNAYLAQPWPILFIRSHWMVAFGIQPVPWGVSFLHHHIIFLIDICKLPSFKSCLLTPLFWDARENCGSPSSLWCELPLPPFLVFSFLVPPSLK